MVMIWLASSGEYGDALRFQDLLSRFVRGKIGIQYWFFLPLFGIYLVISVLSAIPASKRLAVFRYAIGAMFAVQIVLPFVHRVLEIVPVSENLLNPAGGRYLIFTMPG